MTSKAVTGTGRIGADSTTMIEILASSPDSIISSQTTTIISLKRVRTTTKEQGLLFHSRNSVIPRSEKSRSYHHNDKTTGEIVVSERRQIRKNGIVQQRRRPLLFKGSRRIRWISRFIRRALHVSMLLLALFAPPRVAAAADASVAASTSGTERVISHRGGMKKRATIAATVDYSPSPGKIKSGSHRGEAMMSAAAPSPTRIITSHSGGSKNAAATPAAAAAAAPTGPSLEMKIYRGRGGFKKSFTAAVVYQIKMKSRKGMIKNAVTAYPTKIQQKRHRRSRGGEAIRNDRELKKAMIYSHMLKVHRSKGGNKKSKGSSKKKSKGSKKIKGIKKQKKKIRSSCSKRTSEPTSEETPTAAPSSAPTAAPSQPGPTAAPSPQQPTSAPIPVEPSAAPSIGPTINGQSAAPSFGPTISGPQSPSVNFADFYLEYNLNGGSAVIPDQPTQADIQNLLTATEAFYLSIFEQAYEGDNDKTVEAIDLTIIEERFEQFLALDPDFAAQGVIMDLYLEFDPVIRFAEGSDVASISEIQAIMAASSSEFARYILDYVRPAGEVFERTTHVGYAATNTN